MEEKTLAMEMLKELKSNAKRWFLISVILLIALVGSNVAWLIYESQYETVSEENSQEAYYSDNSTVTQSIK